MLLTAALLAPAVRALPAWTAAEAGEGAWLTGAAAFPVLLAEGALAAALLKGGTGGLAESFQAALGAAAGKGLTIIYMVWGLLLLSLEARLAAERMLSAGYRGSSRILFLLVVLGLTLWMGRRKLAAFARAAEIFYLALTLMLGLVLVFAILDMTPWNVLPIWAEDLPGILRATAVPVGALSCGVMGGFLWGAVEPGRNRGRRGVRWLAWGCGAVTLLQFGVLAQLGPTLCARLDSPFFEAARGVGIAGAFQRVESIVVALWLFSDLAVLGLLVFACRAMAGSVWRSGARWAPWGCCLTALMGAMFLFPDGRGAMEAASTWVLMGNFLLAFPIPALVLLVSRLRKKRG